MNNAVKRIEIATEVLSLLRKETLQAIFGIYVRPHLPAARHTAEVRHGACATCAIGALVVAATSNTVRGFTGSDAKEVATILAPYFDSKQLALIEAAYEQDEQSEQIRSTVLDIKLACTPEFAQARSMYNMPIHKEVMTAKQVLTAIMENIIKNNGTFVVS